jgi:hypothetical protein
LELFKRLLKKGCSKCPDARPPMVRPFDKLRTGSAHHDRQIACPELAEGKDEGTPQMGVFQQPVKKSMPQTQGCVGVDCSRSQGGEE